MATCLGVLWHFDKTPIRAQSPVGGRPTTEPFPDRVGPTDLAAAGRRPEIPVGISRRRVRRVGARFVGGDDRAAFVVDAVREGHQRHGQP